MKILHISDTHGTFPIIPDTLQFDCIIHSGDLLPNMSRTNVPDIFFQKQYIKTPDVITSFKKFITKPFFYCPGNHDRISPLLIQNVMRNNKLPFTSIANKVIVYQNISMYGFPFVPPITGEWNYETDDNVRSLFVKNLIDVVNVESIDILVSHGPMFGKLDKRGDINYGDKLLLDAFSKFTKLPKLFLHGHMHDDNGIDNYQTTLISNAATTYRILDINNDGKYCQISQAS